MSDLSIHSKSQKFVCREGVLLALATATVCHATVIDLSSADSTWNSVLFATGVTNDYIDDEQTGSIASPADIVGNTTVPGAMWKFDDSGTASTTDGDIAFRMRLGSPNGSKSYFPSVSLFGLDLNRDAKIDVYLASGRSGPSDYVWVADPGTGQNISPSTSTFTLTDGTGGWNRYNTTYGATGNIYYAQTTDGVDVDGTTSGPDWYFAFQLPFNDLVTTVYNQLGMTIDETTPLSFIVATTNQQNNLNQDVGGVDNKTADLSQTWTQLGAITTPVSADGERTELIWTGLADGGGRNIEWSQNAIPGNLNWIYENPTSTVTYTQSNFLNGDKVTFQDSVLTNGQQLTLSPAAYLPATPGSQTVTISNGDVAPSSVTFSNSSANYLLNGTNAITGTTGLLKTGSGRLTIANSNSYSGNTVVNGGTLEVTGVIGGGTTSVNTGALLIGSGSVSDLAISSGGTLNTGAVNGIGTLTVTGSASFNPGGSYQWEMMDTAVLPGVNQDYLAIDGILDLANLNAAETFTLDLANITANPTGWNNGALPHSWTIAEATGGISIGVGVDVNTLFTITNNSLSTSAASDWQFFVSLDGDKVVFNYIPIPEPATLSLLALAAAALLRRRR